MEPVERAFVRAEDLQEHDRCEPCLGGCLGRRAGEAAVADRRDARPEALPGPDRGDRAHLVEVEPLLAADVQPDPGYERQPIAEPGVQRVLEMRMAVDEPWGDDAPLEPLALSVLAATAHARGFVTGAVAHSFSRWAWSRARFPLSGEQYRAEIDALAIRKGNGKFERINRTSVKFPPTENNRIGTAYTSMCGTVVRVEIERATGALRIAKAYSVFECGTALVPEVVLGQAQGGFAMGVGYALLETLPPFEGGPGNGEWNLGRYLVARGSDLPLRDLEIEMLKPQTSDEAPKGMAEVVMIPIVPALINAIHDATGHRFRTLPVTASLLKGVLA